MLPPDAPAHVAADKLSEFGPETSTAELLLTGTSEADVSAYSTAVAGVDGVVAVQPVAAEGGSTLLRATWAGNTQSEDSQALVEAIRDVEPASGEVLVGGQSAATVDLIDSVGSHLPLMGLIVAGVMLVLLFLAFGSLVLPVKAIVMNLFSITAAFGVVTWIFADGHLSDTLGFEPQGFLDATNPILMLAILFGLSMDYEVFLLSRIREQWDRTGDNDEAVATGVQKTGRIITSAAVLLAVVIGAFATSGIVFMKMLGIGMLVALLIDATIVRALLVPATMKLLGRWNWWAPGPMARWWERHGFREDAPPPAAGAGARARLGLTPRVLRHAFTHTGTRSLVAAVVLSTALLTGCGGDGGGRRDGGDDDGDFAAQSADEISDAAKEAMADLEAVTIDGTPELGGPGDRDQRCRSAAAATAPAPSGPRAATAEILGVDGTTWFKPDAAFWELLRRPRGRGRGHRGGRGPVGHAARGRHLLQAVLRHRGVPRPSWSTNDDATYTKGDSEEIDGEETIEIVSDRPEQGTSSGYVRVDGDALPRADPKTDGEDPGKVTFSGFDEAPTSRRRPRTTR